MNGILINKRGRFGILSSRQGFTFIEMLISLALMATLIAIFGMGLVAAMQSFDFSRANVEVVQKGQMAMARITRELTEITAIRSVDPYGEFIVYDRVVQTSDGISKAVTYCLQFKPNDRQIILFNDIAPDTIEPPESGGDLLTDGVSGLRFQFWEGDSPWTFSPSGIAYLSTIQIEMDVIRPDTPEQPHAFKTLIHLRNTRNQGGAKSFDG